MLKILITVIALFAFEANAQFNPLKALKDVTEAVKSIEQPKEQPVQEERSRASNRLDPLAQMRNGSGITKGDNGKTPIPPRGTRVYGRNVVQYNCSGEGNYNIYEGTDESPGSGGNYVSHICLPKVSYLTNDDLIYEVKNHKMVQQNLADLNDCHFDRPNTHEIKIDGGRPAVDAILICTLGEDIVQLRVKADATEYYVYSMHLAVCGPRTNVEGSVWDEKIKAKYAGIQSGGSRTDSYSVNTKFTGQMKRYTKVGLEIDQGLNGPLADFKVCDGNTSEWTFKISTGYTTTQDFEQRMVQRVANQQSSGDDF